MKKNDGGIPVTGLITGSGSDVSRLLRILSQITCFLENRFYYTLMAARSGHDGLLHVAATEDPVCLHIFFGQDRFFQDAWPELRKIQACNTIRNYRKNKKTQVLSISLSVFSASSFIRADILLEDE